MSKNAFKLLFVVELIVLIAMLLADFGIISAKLEPTSTKSIMIHISVVILLVLSVFGIKRAK